MTERREWNRDDKRNNNNTDENNNENDRYHNNNNDRWNRKEEDGKEERREGRRQQWNENRNGMRNGNNQRGRERRGRDENRINRDQWNQQVNDSDSMKQRREMRFKSEENKTINNSQQEGGERNDIEFIGTCTIMEKEYMRLTSKPISSLVRPQKLIEEWLPLLTQRFEEKEVNYNYFSDQMKSIRQDLTVQNIKNSFLCRVYFDHMKAASTNNDMQEFLVCLACLENLGVDQILSLSQQAKVLSCRLLTCYLQEDRETLNELVNQSKRSQMNHKHLKYSLNLILSLNSFQNYHQFFRMANDTKNSLLLFLSSSISAKVLRRNSLEIICKAYRPSVPLSFVSEELGFDGSDHLKSCLQQWDALMDDSQEHLLCKESQIRMKT
eukprot:TRINITY_DN4310_c0_g2_i4.p1 TRINITY_DN4310_c0_g2~~TRINITY_DN4310_c0_g2_i4.p1  ORF type:complete len:382 (-),score=137.55 TRINITY_DN4310_c0_g2_i4:40-1185(-)